MSDSCYKEANHNYANWPEEEAKLYFVEKPISGWRDEMGVPFEKLANNACVYRNSVPYKPFVSKRT